MKIYISIPVLKDYKKARERADVIMVQLSKSGYEPVNPFDIYCGKDSDPFDRLCSNIRVLLDCDAVYMCKGWQESKVCHAERAIAEIYGKQLKFETVEMPGVFWQNY